ncbi:MAG TPA: DUF3386 domain-containing protein [Nostocaceae cyanobacterium]|nr:DUF3386 domain-containing protein [Nostocaceae cyanobacterium]
MTVTQVSAKELFQAAYENRYTWDQNFPGYTADVTYNYDGQVVTAKLHIDASLKAEVSEIEDEAAKKAIHGQAWETAIHRVRRSFNDTHGANTFSYGETDANGAVEIIMGGKASGDKYKIHHNEVVLVHRHIHGVVITINTFTSHQTGEGYLSHTYDSVYHDPQTGVQKGGKSYFTDEYVQVGNYHILSRREIRTEVEGKINTQEYIFSNIQLLETVAA